MAKALKPIIGGALLGVLSFATFGVGTGLFASLAGALSAGSVVTALGAGLAGGIYAGALFGISSLLKPKIPRMSDEFGRELQLSGDPVAPRKIIYGTAWTSGCPRRK